MICKFCKQDITFWEAEEVTSYRTISRVVKGKLEIGDRLVLKHYKSFRCPSCHLELTKNKNTALKLINK